MAHMMRDMMSALSCPIMRVSACPIMRVSATIMRVSASVFK